MYYVTFLRMSHFLWCRCTRGGQGRFWQGFGFSVRHGLVGHGSWLPGLARVLVVTETDVPVRSVLAVLRARHDGRIALGSFGAVTAGCEGAGPELVAALAGSAKPSRPTVTPALARSIEDAFFMSPLRVH